MDFTTFPTIGCLGRARTGKGTTAAIVVDWAEKRGYPVQIISFADPIKDFLTLLVGRPEPFRGTDAERNAPVPEIRWSQLTTDLLIVADGLWPELHVTVSSSDNSPTGRQLMMLFGTEVIRNHFINDTWIRCAKSRAKNFAGITVVDDVRFENEAIPRDQGGLFDHVFLLTRKSVPRIDHGSENAVDLVPDEHIDQAFNNDTTINDLATRVTGWLDREFPKKSAALG